MVCLDQFRRDQFVVMIVIVCTVSVDSSILSSQYKSLQGATSTFVLTIVRPSRSSPRKRATRERTLVDLSVFSYGVSDFVSVSTILRQV